MENSDAENPALQICLAVSMRILLIIQCAFSVSQAICIMDTYSYTALMLHVVYKKSLFNFDKNDFIFLC